MPPAPSAAGAKYTKFFRFAPVAATPSRPVITCRFGEQSALQRREDAMARHKSAFAHRKNQLLLRDGSHDSACAG